MKANEDKAKAKAKINKTKTTLHSKQQIIASNKYSNRRDILDVLLEDEKNYSLEEIEQTIDEFMKGKVK